MGADAQEPLLAASASSSPAKVPEPVGGLFEVAGIEVEVWNDDCFSRLRKFHGIPESFCAKSKADDSLNSVARCSTFDLQKPRQEGVFGKGGHHQYLSSCRNFICKSLADGDHKSLLRRTESYVDRMLTGDSLLVPIYMHFRDPNTRVSFCIMRNLAPVPDGHSSQSRGYWDHKYDLKGCDDDKTLERDGKMVRPVRRRWYRVDRWFHCCWTPPRWDYWQGKESARKLMFTFPPDQQRDVVRRVQGDVDWLIQQGLMDYSLFLAVRKTTLQKIQEVGAASQGAPPGVRQYAMLEGQDTVVVVALGIIDFLQQWTAGKKAAQCIKMAERNKATIPPEPYGKRFARHFADRFKADDTLLEQRVFA